LQQAWNSVRGSVRSSKAGYGSLANSTSTLMTEFSGGTVNSGSTEMVRYTPAHTPTPTRSRTLFLTLQCTPFDLQARPGSLLAASRLCTWPAVVYKHVTCTARVTLLQAHASAVSASSRWHGGLPVGLVFEKFNNC